MTDTAKRLLLYLRGLGQAEAVRCLDDPSIQADLKASLSPLRHGQIAARANRRLENRLVRRLVARALAGEPAPVLPECDPRRSIPVARIVGSDTILWRPLDAYTGHGCFPGATGSGKTNAEVVHADAFVEKQVEVTFFARKEAGRLLARYPDALLLRVHQLPVNFAQAIGEPRLFFPEWVPIVARGIGVRSDYVPKFLEVVLRAHASGTLTLKLLEKIFKALGQRGDRRCETIAAALATFNLFLGDTARVESAPAWESQSRVTILDREGAPPHYRACVDGLMQLRFQAQAAQEGYTQRLRRVLFYDEAGLEFGREFEAQQIGAGFVSSGKRAISQMRCYGVCIICSAQSYASLAQDIRDNTNLVCAFRSLATEDLRELVSRMQLTERQKLRLPVLPPGRAFVAAPDLPGVIEVQFEKLELGPYPSESEISARMQPALKQLRERTAYTPEDPIEPLDLDELLDHKPTDPAAPLEPTSGDVPANNALLADHWALLRDVVQFENSGVAERFHRLGFGGSKGTRIKEELIALGLLEVIEVRQSAIGRAAKLLRLTPLARTLPDL